MLDTIWKTLERHRFTFAAVAIVAVLAGCELWNPTVPSPLNDKPVTRAQLYAEAEAVVAKFEAAEATLDDKEALKNKLVSIAAQIGAGINDPFGLVPTALGLLAAGATGDNVRKNLVIRRLKNGVNGEANGEAK